MFRRWRPISLACALALALPASAAADGPAAYQADPAHSGAPAGTAFAPPLGKRWVRRDLGGSTSYPVIAEGRAYVAAGSSLYALDLKTGGTIWSRSLKTVGVAYDAGRVFAVDSQGVMQAFAAATGEKIWSAELAGSSSYFSAPTAYGGYVYVSSDYTVYGVRQADGIVVWAQNAAASETSPPAVDKDKTYTAAGCGETSALQRTIGAEVWHYTGECTGGGGGSAIALRDDRVYTSDRGPGVLLLDALLGTLADSVGGLGPPAFADDSGYYRSDRAVFARSESSGLVQWRTPIESSTVGPLLVAGGFVYARDGEGNVLALSRANGQVVWQRALGSGYDYDRSAPLLPGMAASGDTLLVASGDRLTAFGPGPDTPGVEDPDKPPADGATMDLQANAKRTVFGKSVPIILDVHGSYSHGGHVEIQADPWPYGAWEHLKDLPLDSSYLTFTLRPSRNTRYRAVYTVTNPAIVSNELELFSDVRFAFRVVARGRRRVLVKVAASGPPEAGLRRRRVFVYHYRPRTRISRRIGSLRLRGKGTKAKGQRLLRTPSLRRTDLFFICRRERRDDGFGPPEPRLRLCGRRIVR